PPRPHSQPISGAATRNQTATCAPVGVLFPHAGSADDTLILADTRKFFQAGGHGWICANPGHTRDCLLPLPQAVRTQQRGRWQHPVVSKTTESPATVLMGHRLVPPG